MAAYKNEKQLMDFYKQCKEKGYTDMTDEKQSLKAKVIAVDLGIKYKSIEDLYQQAEILYTQKERLQNAGGELLFELDEAKRDPEKPKYVFLASSESQKQHRIKVFRRPDGSLYHTVDDSKEKIEGSVGLSVEGSKILSFKYNPSKTIYTGATVGGITTGGFHQTQATYSERIDKTQKVYIEAFTKGARFEVMRILSISPEICERFKRAKLISGNSITCFQSGGLFTDSFSRGTVPTDTNSMLTYASMARDEQRLTADYIVPIYHFLTDVMEGKYPPTDEEVYERASGIYQSAKTSEQFKEAESLFREIAPFYDGAKSMAGRAKQKYEEALQAEKEARILEREAQEKARKRRWKLFLTAGIPIILLCAAGLFALTKFVLPAKRYQQAQSMMQEGRYEEAIAVLDALGDYRDSKDQIELANQGIKEQAKAKEYAAADELLSQGKYEEAEEAFRALEDYRDSQARIEECLAGRYSQAQALLSEGSYDEAIQAFTELGEYGDSQMQVNEAVFQKAKSLITGGNYEDAYELLVPLNGYSNVSDYLNDFYFFPTTITTRSGSTTYVYKFSYDKSMKLSGAVYTLNNDEMNTFVFDEEGRLTQKLLGSYYTDKVGTVAATYTYNADHTVMEHFWAGENRRLFDEYGNLKEMYGTEGTRTGGQVWQRDYATDEHHNRTDNSENKYENGQLVSVYYSKGNLRISTNVEYEMRYLPEQKPDPEMIWQSIRILCVDTIWYT